MKTKLHYITGAVAVILWPIALSVPIGCIFSDTPRPHTVGVSAMIIGLVAFGFTMATFILSEESK